MMMMMMRALLLKGDLCLWWMCLLCAVKDEPLSASASDRLRAALALDASLTQRGFLYLKGHKISTQLLRDARDAVRTFLSQPDDAKAPFALGANGNNRFRGWKRLGENVTRYGGDGDPDDPNAAFARDQHEGIDLYEELPDACLPADSWARGVTA